MENLSWQAPSFHYVEKTSAWYMWSIIASVVIGILALLQGNILFMFFVILAEAMVLMLGKQKPRLLLYEATDTKISVDSYREYPYSELSGFSIVEDPYNSRYYEAVFAPSKRLSTQIKILVPLERAEELRNLLLQFLPEVEYQESISENILKRIGL